MAPMAPRVRLGQLPPPEHDGREVMSPPRAASSWTLRAAAQEMALTTTVSMAPRAPRARLESVLLNVPHARGAPVQPQHLSLITPRI